MTTRRGLLAGAAATGVVAPAVATRATARLLRFVPHDEVTWHDPSFWPFIETRNHALMVYDTLYGLDAQGRVQPQMAEGHEVETGGLLWRIRLREGLVFHDATRVLARDCVASIKRWGGSSLMGKALLDAAHEVTAPDDRTIAFRLRRRFPLLPAALGDRTMQVCAIMPARVAEQAEQQHIREIIGSGPFRFLPGERIPGQVQAYARHEAYVPRPSGTPSFTAGPKVAHFDRIEWRPMPEPEAALAALREGRVDWWETPPAAAYDAIDAAPGLALRLHDHAGYIATMRMNHLNPPFDNPAIRRAVLGAIDQDAFVKAASFAPRALRRTGVGVFAPHSPMASQAGMRALQAPPDPEGARRAIRAAGYGGEKVAVLVIDDLAATRGLGEHGAALLAGLGFDVDIVRVPLRQTVGRLLRVQPPGAGGWSVVFGYWPAHDHWHPGMHRYLRAEGRASEIGWPTSPALEAMRRAWLAADDDAERRLFAADIQVQAFEDVPYIPLGQWARPIACAADLEGMLDGPPLFWNLRRS